MAATADFIPYLNIQAGTREIAVDAAPDQGLLQKKGGRGFPYCTIMAPDGEVIWEVRPTSAEVVTQGFADARLLQSLRKALAEKPDDPGLAASVQLLMNLGKSQREKDPIAKLDELAKAEGVKPEVLARYESWSKVARFDEQFRTALGGATSREEAAKATLALYEAGTLPPEGHPRAMGYWMNVANGAADAKKGDVAKKALAEAKKLAGTDERTQKAISDLEKRIAEL